MLSHVLKGVAAATKAPDHQIKAATDWFDSAENEIDVTSNLEDRAKAISSSSSPVEVQQLVGITLAVAFLRETSRRKLNASSKDLDLVWRLIKGALTHLQQTQVTFGVSRSVQGFFAVPLCSLLKDGNIDELFRLHVWMPDRHRGTAEFAVHSHQSFAQSWIIAGEGTDHRYNVQAVTDYTSATHAEYALAWNAGNTSSTTYNTHQISSTVENTHRFVCAERIQTELHIRDDTYCLPATTFHGTEVEPDAVHATLFFFDSHQGFDKDAGVLGPKDAEISHQVRDSDGLTVNMLAKTVEIIRSYEQHMRRGQLHSERSESEQALRESDIALNIIESANVPTSLAYYRHQTLGAFGVANRTLGRYATARSYLEQALEGLGLCYTRLKISGELAVLYRSMGLLEDARRAAEIEYETASELGLESGICRALGTLGRINYYCFQQNNDQNLLGLAIRQLTEQVESARSITASINGTGIDRKMRAKKAKSSTIWESIGLFNLSLCYTALGDHPKASAMARESLSLAYDLDDRHKILKSHYFYGRTLLKSGLRKEALEQFNVSKGCSPAVMLCQEPSEEHRGYLQELIAAGADIDSVDEKGYTPWDYTVFNGDTKTQEIIREALRRVLKGDDVEQQLEERQKRANTQKAYRELFQEHLRPALLHGGDTVFQTLRSRYANALANDDEKRRLYDGFKFVWYSDFLDFGRLPRSTDSLTSEFVVQEASSHSSMPDLVVFFSYRWINQNPNASSPDDCQNTQYHRMIAALEEFLKIHPKTPREKLGIWMDFACINQDNPIPGVDALPLNLAQCNAIITLVDADYESRAWCAVEALLAHTLQDSYHHHKWYKQLPDGIGDDGRQAYRLQLGQLGLEIPMSEKRLRFEKEDRPKIVFLERQRHLLGNC
ncbi:MAG: hypothetical protein Q9208_003908 [Pyrenodesmia sp. 3 TL-2023]